MKEHYHKILVVVHMSSYTYSIWSSRFSHRLHLLQRLSHRTVLLYSIARFFSHSFLLLFIWRLNRLIVKLFLNSIFLFGKFQLNFSAHWVSNGLYQNAVNATNGKDLWGSQSDEEKTRLPRIIITLFLKLLVNFVIFINLFVGLMSRLVINI